MRKFKRGFKKTVAMASVAAMLTTVTDWSQVSVAAAEDDVVLATESITFSEEEDVLADNDELFAGYVQQAFFENSGISMFSSSHHASALNEAELAIYNALKEQVTKIAAGTEASTEITLSDWSLEFTYTELGLASSASQTDVQTAVGTAFQAKVDNGKVLDCLRADCPYELYWYDKTTSTGTSYSIGMNGVTATVKNLTYRMPVASAYATSTYVADTTKTSAATTAATNAQAIVTANEGKTDYEKLVAYREKICELVEYNDDAASDSTTPYGDPWQLIYVFDNDSTTNVVCEGYSKAFQYLCELSSFSGDVYCYTVTGDIGGGHMWNHVTIGDANYMVDVTNCDGNSIGAPDKLFLKGMEGSIAAGYTKTINALNSITYTFDDDSFALFGTDADSILNLSAEDYVESTDPIQRVSATTSASNVTWRYATGATLTATPTLAAGAATPAYQWYTVSGNTETAISGATSSTYTMETGLDAGTYTYRVYATIDDCEKSADVSVTVKPLVLTASNLEFTNDTITKVYDGTTSSTATAQIKAGVVDASAVAVSGTAVYNSANVADATKVTFTPAAITSGNYTLAATETIEHAATITKKTGTTAPAAPTAATANIKDTEITLDTVTDCEYSKDGTVWQDSPKFTGLTPNTAYTFYQRVKASDNIEASDSSTGATITTLKTSLNSAVLTVTLPSGGYTYDGTAKEPTVSVTLNSANIAASQYDVSYTNNVNAGTATVKITAKAAGQYSGSVSKTFAIAKKAVDVTVTAANKTYDGTKTATVSAEVTTGVAGDTLAISGVTGTFASAAAGTGKTVTINSTAAVVSGDSKANYTLNYPATTTADIAKAALTVSGATVSDKVYDGTTTATVTALTISGLVNNETLTKGTDYTITSAVFDTKTAGDGKAVTVEYTFADTTKLGNYTYSNGSTTGTASITAKALTSSDIAVTLSETAYDYDGTAKMPTVTVKDGTTALTADTDYTVSIASTDGTDTSAGTKAGKVTLKIAGMGNYNGNLTKEFTINKLTLTASIEGTTSKTYDGSKASDGNGLSIKLSGIITTEDVTATATYTYDSETVGENKKIIASDITLGGADAGNYVLSSTTVEAEVGTIVKADADITIAEGSDSYSKVYKDAAFSLSGITYTGDGTLVYTVADSKYVSVDENDAEVSEDVEDDKVITVDANGKVTIIGSGTANIVITATAGTNYNAVENAKTVMVTVAKASNPPYKPETSMSANSSCVTVADVTLSGDWKWTEETAAITFDSVTDGAAITATAVYEGEDAKHYTTTSVAVELTRADHDHVAGDILYTGEGEKAPTCTEAGIGHTECTVEGCGKTITSNVPVDALGHKLTETAKKEATCTESGKEAYWTCSACPKIFADKDGTVETTEEALVIPASGHDWEKEYTVDKAATATTAGSKSIHCAKCDTIKEGSSVEIPKTGGSGSSGSGGSTGGSSTGGSSGGSGGAVIAPTPTPTATPQPSVTPSPEATATPEPTEVPEVSTTPEPTKAPEVTETPEPTKEPEVTETPSPTKAPESVKTPAVGKKLKDTKTKEVYIVTKFSKTGKTVTYQKPKNQKVTTVKIPKKVKIDGVTYKVTAIAKNAFKDCKKLKKITIEGDIQSIGKNAFKGCKNLKSITIKSTKLTLKKVGKDAFKGISSKAVITVPAKKYKTYKKMLYACGAAKTVIIKKK